MISSYQLTRGNDPQHFQDKEGLTSEHLAELSTLTTNSSNFSSRDIVILIDIMEEFINSNKVYNI